MTKQKHLWWQEGIIYQIYPRSFQDSDGDGVGDLKGIISRLPYLKELGIKAIWISPIFPSPMADFGYDISDYKGIHPLFGSMDDFDELLTEVHNLDMKLLLDLVPNHTSDQHPWFLESRSSKNNPKRDWYIWKDAKPDGSEPNNWLAMFGGSAWEWDEKTEQFYYHGFLKEQPDLNWRNPEVQQAMLDIMRFWFDKGIDGFRIDVVYHIIKDEHFRDNPQNPDYEQHEPDYNKLLPVYSTDQHEVLDMIKMMREVADEYEERLLIGEIYLPINKLVLYYGTDNSGVHLPFNFQLMNTDWDAQKIATLIDQYEGAIPDYGWPNWVLSNHDQPRTISRVGSSQARVAAMLLLTLRGTPTIYYGDEIGMRDVPIPEEEVQDPQGLNMKGKNLSRDPSRTSMQWSDAENAGFTTGKPWLRLPADFKRNNVENQQNDPHSMLNFYRRLIALRQQNRALNTGRYRPVYSDSRLLSYIREQDEERFLIILNLSHRPGYFKPGHFSFTGTIQLATTPECEGEKVTDRLDLAGDEGVIIRLD